MSVARAVAFPPVGRVATDPWTTFIIDGATEVEDRVTFYAQLYTDTGETSTLPGRVARTATFARASSGTYVDDDGVLQTAATDAARFGGNNRGLLMEGPSTNLCTYSEAITEAAGWTDTNANITVSADDTAAPDGNTTADGIVASAADALHAIQQAVTVTADATVCCSVFAKAGTDATYGKDKLMLRVVSTTQGTKSAYIDIQGANNTDAVDSGVTAGVERLADTDWYRCWITETLSGGDTSVTFVIAPVNAGGDTTFAGDAATVNVWLWGAQVEEHPYMTSYIANTSTGSTARAQDTLEYDYIPSSSKGSLRLEYETLAPGFASGEVDNDHYLVTGGSAANSLCSAENPQDVFGAHNGTATVRDSQTILAKQLATYGVTWDEDADEMIFYLDGAEGDTETFTAWGTAPTKLIIGNRAAGAARPFYGYLRNIYLYEKVFDAATMRAFTTPWRYQLTILVPYKAGDHSDAALGGGIAAALATASANGGGVVRCGVGTFTCAGEIDIPPHVTLEGEGIDSTILNFTHTNGDPCLNFDPTAGGADLSYQTLRDLTVARAAGCTSDGIKNVGQGFKESKIENVKITGTDTSAWAVNLSNVTTSNIERLYIRCSGNGIKYTYDENDDNINRGEGSWNTVVVYPVTASTTGMRFESAATGTGFYNHMSLVNCGVIATGNPLSGSTGIVIEGGKRFTITEMDLENLATGLVEDSTSKPCKYNTFVGITPQNCTTDYSAVGGASTSRIAVGGQNDFETFLLNTAT